MSEHKPTTEESGRKNVEEKEDGYTKKTDQISKLREKKRRKKSGARIPNTVPENG